jgi:hypothetical protein
MITQYQRGVDIKAEWSIPSAARSVVSEYPTSNRCDEHDGGISVIRVNCIVAGVPHFGG